MTGRNSVRVRRMKRDRVKSRPGNRAALSLEAAKPQPKFVCAQLLTAKRGAATTRLSRPPQAGSRLREGLKGGRWLRVESADQRGFASSAQPARGHRAHKGRWRDYQTGA